MFVYVFCEYRQFRVRVHTQTHNTSSQLIRDYFVAFCAHPILVVVVVLSLSTTLSHYNSAYILYGEGDDNDNDDNGDEVS